MRVETSISIKRPAAEVFAYVADQRNKVQYDPGTKSIEKVLPGPVSQGTRFHASEQSFGDVDVDFTEYEAPRRLAIESETKMGHGRMVYVLESEGSGTRLIQIGVMRPKGLAKLMTPLMGPMLRKHFEAMGASLKERLVQAATGSAGGNDRGSIA